MLIQPTAIIWSAGVNLRALTDLFSVCSTPAAVFWGIGTYLLLSGVTIAAGLGIVSLLRVDVPGSVLLLLSSVVGFSYIGLIVGVAGVVNFPFKLLWPGIWMCVLAPGAYGLWSKRRALRSGDWAIVLLCGMAPLIEMWRYFWCGLAEYQGGIAPDGWSYVAYGQYMWEYSRGTSGGLAPLHQYAAHLAGTRYISAGLLAVLSPLSRMGDTQPVAHLLQAWSLFPYASAVALFCRSIGQRTPVVVAATLLSVCTGWIANLVWANNYDNGLVLMYMPAMASVAFLGDLRRWQWWLMLGLLLSSLMYKYIEGTPLAAGGAFLCALHKVWGDRSSWRVYVRGGRTALMFLAVLVLPNAGMVFSFAESQFRAVTALPPGTLMRPGEVLFAGLTSPHYLLSSFWGLGGEHQIGRFGDLQTLLAIGLTLVASYGFWGMIRQSLWGLVASASVLTMLIAYLIGVERYGYGAYKVLVLEWWLLAFGLVFGAIQLVDRLRRPLQSATLTIAVASGLLLVVRPHETSPIVSSPYQFHLMNDFRELEQIDAITGDQTVLIMVDNWLPHQWAVYFLRSHPIAIIDYRMYMAMPHVRPSMERARPVSVSDARFVLTDTTQQIDPALGWVIRWQSDVYRLWDTRGLPWARINMIINPNGLETLEGQPFFWIGQGETRIAVWASDDGTLALAGEYIFGPSVVDVPTRRIQVQNETIGTLREETLSGDENEVTVPVRAGINQIVIRPLDVPNAPAGNNDPRPLILGVRGLSVHIRPQVWVERIENPNGLEQLDAQPFFWVGADVTHIYLRSETAGWALLTGELIAGPSIPGIGERRIQLAISHRYRVNALLQPGSLAITVPIDRGTTVIELRALDTPTVTVHPNGDTRILLLGIKSMSVELLP